MSNNNTINEYGYRENNSIYTWLEETRDWRAHEHRHLTEATESIIKNTDDAENKIMKNVNGTREEILTAVGNVNSYIINTVMPSVNEIKSDVKENKSMITSIWNKIKGWTIN